MSTLAGVAAIPTKLARQGANRVTLVDGESGVAVTAAELDRRRRQLANLLLSSNLVPGDRVAVVLPNGVPAAQTLYGIATAGLVQVNVNERLTPTEIAFILDDSEAKVVLVDRRLLDKLQDCSPDLTRIVVDSDFERRLLTEPEDEPGVTIDLDDPAMLIYTSGTTGRPKGVQLSHRNVIESATNYLMESFDSEAESYLACVPYFHVACVPHIAALMRGMKVVVSGFEPRRVAELIERHRITHVALVPTAISMLLDILDSEVFDLSSLRRVLYAASPMPEPTLRRGIARFGPIFEQFYGLTETAGLVTILRANEHDIASPTRLASCGREVTRVDVELMDETGSIVADGSPGEIVVRGANVMTGYWGLPEATAAAHFGEWFRTGDAGTRDADGFITIVGRLKDMIISGGNNVYPVEVEKVLEEHPGIDEVAVVGVPHPVWGETVAAVITGEETIDVLHVRAWCRDRLADYKQPRLVRRLDSLPRNALGKVDKRALRAVFEDAVPTGAIDVDA